MSDRAMLKAVHGALVDAGLSMGEIGTCEADAVRLLTRERDEALRMSCECFRESRAAFLIAHDNALIERMALGIDPRAVAAHDNALIERCAAALDRAAFQWSYLAGRGDSRASDKRQTYECAASMVRALKTDSEGSTT